jgi:hypothetical protein
LSSTYSYALAQKGFACQSSEAPAELAATTHSRTKPKLKGTLLTTNETISYIAHKLKQPTYLCNMRLKICNYYHKLAISNAITDKV